MDFANGVVSGARNAVPLHDVKVRSTSDILNVDVAGGVVVASLIAAVVNGVCGRGLGGRHGVRERHATQSYSQWVAQT
jgi:hypothetical protein